MESRFCGTGGDGDGGGAKNAEAAAAARTQISEGKQVGIGGHSLSAEKYTT